MPDYTRQSSAALRGTNASACAFIHFGWYAGDFNLDGKINIDDYGLIDSIIGAQGPVL
jgi:hypothetical protein